MASVNGSCDLRLTVEFGGSRHEGEIDFVSRWGPAAFRAAHRGGETIRGWLTVNTLAVFAFSATGGIGMIVGSLVAMCWVEQRMVGGRPRMRPRSRAAARPQPALTQAQQTPGSGAVPMQRGSSTTSAGGSRGNPDRTVEERSRRVGRDSDVSGSRRTKQITAASRVVGLNQGRVAMASGALAVAALACVASQRHGDPSANTSK